MQAAPPPVAAAPERPCVHCGQPAPRQGVLCPHCGGPLRPRRHDTEERSPAAKLLRKAAIAVGGAALLALLVRVAWRLAGDAAFPDPLVVGFFFVFLLVGVLLLNTLLE